MSIASMLLGRLVVGVEDDEEETGLADEGQKPIVRVYLDRRYENRYVLAAGRDAERLKQQWGGIQKHLFMPVPPGTPVYQAVPATTKETEA